MGSLVNSTPKQGRIITNLTQTLLKNKKYFLIYFMGHHYPDTDTKTKDIVTRKIYRSIFMNKDVKRKKINKYKKLNPKIHENDNTS